MRILVGVTGGIAAYKSAQIVRLLTEQGHEVKVLPTANALRFIGSDTLEALSHNSIDPDLYSQVADVKHIKLAQEAELVIVAPATAAFIARYANGIADDLLLNVLLATKAPVVIAPAMHSEMWTHPATQRNLSLLKQNSVTIIEPESGRLTGSDSGIGRMVEPEDIVARSLALASYNLDLIGKSVLIAAGGTREPIDSVRFIGNSSSGRQGIALAQAARDRGAAVTLVAANIDLPIPASINTIRVATHAQLYQKITSIVQDYDIVLMPAAVSDFGVKSPVSGKMHRSDDPHINLELVPNSDILQEISASRSHHRPIIVGFAAEFVDSNEELEKLGRKKLESKGCDMIVANNVSDSSVFGSDSNQVLIIDSKSTVSAEGSKLSIANTVFDQILPLMPN